MWNEARWLQPNKRSHRHHRPGRDNYRRCGCRRPDLNRPSGRLLLDFPVEFGAIGQDAVQHDGDLACDRDLGLLGPDPPHQPCDADQTGPRNKQGSNGLTVVALDANLARPADPDQFGQAACIVRVAPVRLESRGRRAERAQSAELTHEELAAMKAAVQVVSMADRLIEPPNECS